MTVVPTAMHAVDMVTAAIRGHRYHYADEYRLQEGLTLAITAAGLPVRREVRLTPTDRIDLLTVRVGVEVKVAGTPDAVLRQLQRYATSPQVDALVLVTTRARHQSLPRVVGGKPLTVVYLGGVA